MTSLRITSSHLKIAHRRMTTAIKLIFAQPLLAGAPPLMRSLMGDRMLHCRAFTQRGSSALGPDLGSQLVLELLVRADVQAPALSKPGFGALGAHRTRLTGAGRKLGGFAWDHRHGLSMRTGDGRVHKIQGEVVFREEVPNLRLGACPRNKLSGLSSYRCLRGDVRR